VPARRWTTVCDTRRARQHYGASRSSCANEQPASGYIFFASRSLRSLLSPSFARDPPSRTRRRPS
jgi:hypothetical protein